MTELHFFAATDGRALSRVVDPETVSRSLADINVRYEHVDLPPVALDALADQDEVIEAYRLSLDGLMQEDGFRGLDVFSVQPGQSNQAELHRYFMTAHAHAGIEGHLLLEGAGTYYMRVGAEVYALHCMPGDFIRLPGGLRHWFDMGKQPAFRSIRFYHEGEDLEGVGLGSDMRGMYVRNIVTEPEVA